MNQEKTFSAPRLSGVMRFNRSGFSLGGHRLSSLYRDAIKRVLILILGKKRSISWLKYSAGGAGGAKPPARAAE